MYGLQMFSSLGCLFALLIVSSNAQDIRIGEKLLNSFFPKKWDLIKQGANIFSSYVHD
jgi:hypothetical protein